MGLLVHGPDQNGVAVGHDMVRIATVGEEQLDEIHSILYHGKRQGRLGLGSGREIRIGAVLDEHLGRLHGA